MLFLQSLHIEIGRLIVIHAQIEQTLGDQYHLGDHLYTTYYQDQFNHPNISPVCGSQKSQDELKFLWESSSSPETTETITSPDVYSHKIKRVDNDKIHCVERFSTRWTSTLNLISRWQCNKCPYGSSAMPHHHTTDINKIPNKLPPVLLSPPAECALKKLDFDCLYAISHHLSSESLITFSRAYSRFREVMEFFHVLLRRELRCFFLHVPLHETTLGIGIALDARTRTLFSDFDWLSMEAFDTHGIRLSIEKRSFHYFLPLAFSRSNFIRVLPEIMKRLHTIDLGLREAEGKIERRTRRKSNRRTGPPIKPYDSVEVLCRMMNTIVVALMKSCDDLSSDHVLQTKQTLLFASEKAVTSYCLLLHLLMCLCRSQPEILSDVTIKLRQFIEVPKTRWKQSTPDLGELIVVITLVLIMPPVVKSQPITWDLIRGKFLEEAVTRNVRWVLDAAPELEVMEYGASDYRLNTTFNNSKTSLRLIMFQVTFLNVFLRTYQGDISRLDENYGFAESELPVRMVKEIKEIYAVDSWPQFFARVNLGRVLGKETFSQMLRDTIQESARRGYHRPATMEKLSQLRRLRNETANRRI